MTLTSKQHNIPRSGFPDGQADCRPSVGLSLVFRAGALQTHKCVVDNGERVLAARVVGGEDYEITTSSSRFPHQRALCAIPVSAAAENGNNPTLSGLLNECSSY